MSHNNLCYFEEVAIEKFILYSFNNMLLNFKFLKYPLNSTSIRKYSSIIITSILDYLKIKNCNNIFEVQSTLKRIFFEKLINFNNENEYKNLERLKEIENYNNLYLTFYIWCVDAFYYFLKYGNNSYNILKNYSSMIEYILNGKTIYHTIVELNEALYLQVEKK